MSCDDLNLSLELCAQFLKLVLDDDGNDYENEMEVDGGKVVEEGNAGLEVVVVEGAGVGVGEEIEEDETDGGLMDGRLMDGGLMDGEEVLDGREEVRIDTVEEIVDSVGVRTESGGTAYERLCKCSKVIACAANESCCYMWGGMVEMEVDPAT